MGYTAGKMHESINGMYPIIKMYTAGNENGHVWTTHKSINGMYSIIKVYTVGNENGHLYYKENYL